VACIATISSVAIRTPHQKPGDPIQGIATRSRTSRPERIDEVQYGEIQRDWLKLFAGLFADMTAPAGDLVGLVLLDTRPEPGLDF
jgi:hypothetical protein